MAGNQRDIWDKIIAIISTIIVPLSIFGLGWFLKDEIQIGISQQALELEKKKVDFSKRTVELDNIRTDIAKSASTLDSIRTDIAQQMLELERTRTKIMDSNRKIENLTLELSQARFAFEQREAKSRSDIESTSRSLEFAQNLSNLKPSIDIECSAQDKSEMTNIQIKCKFTNRGKYGASISPKKFDMVDKFSSVVLGTIATIEKNSPNYILPSMVGSDIYIVRLNERGLAQAKNHLAFKIHFLAETEKSIIDQLKSIYNGKERIKKINQASIQGYNMTFK